MEALNLFWILFKVGLFCFGGGNAMIGVFERLLVSEHGYMTQTEFADMVAISQITPGPVAINLATYAGAALGDSAVKSVFYSFIATIGISLPSFFIVIIIARFFKQFGNSKHVKRVMAGIKPAVIGLITGSVLLLCRYSIINTSAFLTEGVMGAINFGALLIAVISFTAAVKTKISPILVLLASGIAGVVFL